MLQVLRPHRVPRARVAAVLVAGAVALTACSGDVVPGSGVLADGASGAVSSSAGPLTSVTPTVVAPSPYTPASSAPGPASSSPQVSPSLDLLRKLRTTTTASWVPITDSATSTTFSLPARVPARQRTQNGIAQRLYQYQVSKQSGVSVSFVRAPSAAAATALLRLYPQQLAASFRSLGADDAAVSEQSSGTVAGLPATSFRFAFTPATVPQIKPVWLVSAVATGSTVVLLQTIVFPPNTEFDYASPARQAQQRLVTSFRAG